MLMLMIGNLFICPKKIAVNAVPKGNKEYSEPHKRIYNATVSIFWWRVFANHLTERQKPRTRRTLKWLEYADLYDDLRCATRSPDTRAVSFPFVEQHRGDVL